MVKNTTEQLAINRQRALIDVPLLSRDRELSKLFGLTAAKTPALICGPPGLGKTRLLRELKRKLDTDGVDSVYLRFVQPLHAFLVEIANQLSVSAVHSSSIGLKGALWKSFESKPCVILLDDIAEATPPFYRFFERVLAGDGNTIIGAALHPLGLGAFHRVFWNQHATVNLHPLSKLDANTLVEHAVATFLSNIPIPDDFALRVLQASRGNPGRIVDMCIRAANPAYQAEDHHLRFGAVVMDSVTGFLP